MVTEMISRVPPPPSPSDRIQVTLNPPSLPGTCVICNASSNGIKKFVDFNFSLDYYGAVYFCIDCITPIALSLGFCPVKDLLEAEQEANELRGVLEEAENGLEYYRSFVKSLSRVRPDLGDVTILSGQDQESDDKRTSFTSDE